HQDAVDCLDLEPHAQLRGDVAAGIQSDGRAPPVSDSPQDAAPLSDLRLVRALLQTSEVSPSRGAAFRGSNRHGCQARPVGRCQTANDRETPKLAGALSRIHAVEMGTAPAPGAADRRPRRLAPKRG